MVVDDEPPVVCMAIPKQPFEECISLWSITSMYPRLRYTSESQETLKLVLGIRPERAAALFALLEHQRKHWTAEKVPVLSVDLMAHVIHFMP